MGSLKRELDHRFLRGSRISRRAYGVLDRFRLVRRAVGGARPLTARDREAGPRPVFIVGSGRSGNTLMRLLLVEGGEVSIPPESYFLPTLYRRFSVLRELAWEDLCRLLVADLQAYPGFRHWGLDEETLMERFVALPRERHTLADLIDTIYRTYGGIHTPGHDRWGDKTPKNTLYVRQLDQVFPRAQYIHLIRDGRDVCSSYLRAGIHTDVEDAARVWTTAVTAATRFGKSIGPRRYHEVRYEDLVAAPKEVLARVCRFLEITYDARMLGFWKRAEAHGDTVEAHHRNLKNPISPASVGKWREQLPPESVERIMPLIRPTLERLGYGTDAPVVPPSAVAKP